MDKLKISLIFISLFISACGLKVTEVRTDNVLDGSWKLSQIICVSRSNSNLEVEKYSVPSADNVVLTFSGQRVNYSVGETSCITSATGEYATDFDGSSTGIVEFVNVVTATACNISIIDTGSNSVGSVDIPMGLLAHETTSLNWVVNSDNLKIDNFTGFAGSLDNSGCQGICNCYGNYTRQ